MTRGRDSAWGSHGASLGAKKGGKARSAKQSPEERRKLSAAANAARGARTWKWWELPRRMASKKYRCRFMASCCGTGYIRTGDYYYDRSGTKGRRACEDCVAALKEGLSK